MKKNHFGPNLDANRFLLGNITIISNWASGAKSRGVCKCKCKCNDIDCTERRKKGA
jgi:hypothetical protein